MLVTPSHLILYFRDGNSKAIDLVDGVDPHVTLDHLDRAHRTGEVRPLSGDPGDSRAVTQQSLARPQQHQRDAEVQSV